MTIEQHLKALERTNKANQTLYNALYYKSDSGYNSIMASM